MSRHIVIALKIKEKTATRTDRKLITAHVSFVEQRAANV